MVLQFLFLHQMPFEHFCFRMKKASELSCPPQAGGSTKVGATAENTSVLDLTHLQGCTRFPWISKATMAEQVCGPKTFKGFVDNYFFELNHITSTIIIIIKNIKLWCSYMAWKNGE